MTLHLFSRRIAIGIGFLATAFVATAQPVQKLADLAVGADGNGVGYGPNTPECRFLAVGTNLWFTSNQGGADGVGGVFIFDPFTSNVTQVATLNNDTGKNPWAASLMVAGGRGWFTTSVGGTGSKGSLCSIDLTNYAVSNVFNFPTNADWGWSPHSTPILIGDDLWFTTSSGGVPPDGSTLYGAIVKYNLTSGGLTNVFSLDGTDSGRQLLANSLVAAGKAYYYLSFSGGTNTFGGTPNGAGVLGRLTFDEQQRPTLATVAQLPGRFVSFPAGDPVFDGTNALYFTTAGVATNPGAIVRFDVATSNLVTLFTFVTNGAAVTNYGKQPYGTPVLYNNELYFTTLSGGTVGKGILGKLSLSNNVVTKLADFEGTANLALGASPQYNSGTVFTNPADGRRGIYFPINKGGVNNFGTIVRVNLPPPPILASLTETNGLLKLAWSGGYAPYGVDARWGTLESGWQTNWVSGLNTNAVWLEATNTAAYFRVSGADQ